MKKKIIAIFLAVLMVLSVMPMSAFAGSDITIADILPEDFPLCVDVLPENVWTNENGLYLMLVDTCLVLTSEDQGDYVLAGDITTAVLTKNENNYNYTNDGATTIFVMEDNALLNIKVEGLTDEFVDFNGTYAAPKTYTVTYDGNDATSGTVPDAQTKVHDVDLTLASNTGNLAKVDYVDSVKIEFVFKGWNDDPDGEGVHYDEGAAYTGNEDVTLYAEWVELPAAYAITNGTAEDAHGSITVAETAAEGETVTITVNPDEGYQLKSLTVVPATPTTYTVTFATAEHGAIYDAETSGQKVTSISVDGGTAVAVEGNKITIGDKNYYAIANSGYKFNGFENAPAAITEATTVIPVFEADTLTDGYYMIYITDDTTISSTNSSMKLEADEYVPGQYKLDWTFNQGDAIKVVKVENNAIAAWYPDGLWNEYTIPAAEAGERTLLFKPEYTEEWNSWGGYVTIKTKTASKSLNSPAPAEPETITPAKQADGTYQFTMPAYDVTVTAEFEEMPTYAITNGTAEDAHGSISFDKTSVFAEDKVTITVKADKGYKLVEDSLKVYKTNKSGPHTAPIIPVQDEQDDTKYTFVMPAFDVTVTAEFEKTEWQKLADAMSGKEQGTVDGVFEVDDTTTPGTRIIILLTDIKADNAVDSALVVPTACKVVLDLNGHILDRGLTEKTENGHVIKVEYGGELTLRDSDPTADNGEYKGGVITGGNTKKTGGGIWVNGGKLIMEGGTIANNYALNQNGGGVAVCENVRYSGGVIIDKGVFVMKGGVIRDNYAYVGGGVSALAESEIELIGGTITNNRALSKAGGVYAGSAKTVCKIGGSIKITGNYCSYVLIGVTRYMPEGFDDVNANTTEQNLYLSYINKENYAKISISEVAPTTMDVKFTEEHTVSEGETLTIIESLPEEFKASILQYLQMENTENEECYVNEEGKTVIHIPVYLVNIADVTGGSVTADVSFFEVKSFEPDTKTVELTVVPDEGYLFKSLKVTYIDGTEKTVILEQDEQDNTKYTFVMPAFDVTVTAEFEEIKTSGVWFDYCTEQAEYDTSIGAGGNMYWGIRIPKSELQKLSLPVLEKIAFYEFEYTGTHTLFIFQPDANSLPAIDSYIYSQQITVNGINDWHEVILTTPLTVDVEKDLWIILYDEDMVYPGASSAYTGDVNGTLAYVDGEWVSIIDSGLFYTWMLRGYFSVTPRYTVSGTVASFGADTDDITIQLIKEGETDPAYETTVNGNSAEYSIPGVANGNYTLKVTKKNHTTRTYDVEIADEDVTLDIEVNIVGDLNSDGFTDKKDLVFFKNHINKVTVLSDYDEAVGDLNNDGGLDKEDLALLKNHINRESPLY